MLSLPSGTSVDGNNLVPYTRAMTTKVSSTGQLEIPAALRLSDGILAGQEFVIEKVCVGEYRLIATAATPTKPKRQPLDVLRDCPEKDFFMPMEWGTTDQLTPPSFE
jgi:bifunctional DNA-binding transcriptional regulator/antitoxin component of YhaV-PrlF toxin-antitoxin module